jgi:hypothetical protein
LDADKMSPLTSKYDYCKIFVRVSNRETVLASLSAAVGAVRAGFTATAGGLVFDVIKNADAGLGKADDFIFWPTVIDVVADGVPRETVVGTLSALLRYSWAHEIPLVAACPFEDELPWSGGIGLSDS